MLATPPKFRYLVSKFTPDFITNSPIWCFLLESVSRNLYTTHPRNSFSFGIPCLIYSVIPLRAFDASPLHPVRHFWKEMLHRWKIQPQLRKSRSNSDEIYAGRQELCKINPTERRKRWEGELALAIHRSKIWLCVRVGLRFRRWLCVPNEAGTGNSTEIWKHNLEAFNVWLRKWL